jgi:serine/threonine protein kinase
MSLAPDSRLGPYIVGPLLGAGGTGEVYRAQDTVLGRDVALKVLPDSFALDRTATATVISPTWFSSASPLIAELPLPGWPLSAADASYGDGSERRLGQPQCAIARRSCAAA